MDPPCQIGRNYTFNNQKVALRVGGTLYYLYNDHLNSASLTTNSNGNPVHQVRNYPFGETRRQSGVDVSDFGFTDQRDESMRLMDFDARYYDSYLNRFVSPDSIVPDFSNPQSLNRYSYALNNPVKYRDPSGHWVESAIDIASIGYDAYRISQEGWTLENNLSLAADVASLILPAVAGGGVAVRLALHADDAVDTLRVVNEAGNILQTTNEIENVANIANQIDNVSDTADQFVRTIDRAPTNPKNYLLRPDDVTKGKGLSTFADDSAYVLDTTGRKRAVLIPKNDVPSGTEWIKTPGHSMLPERLQNNHWELWHPEQYRNLGPEGYMNWWNNEIASELAKRAANWQVVP